MARTCSTSIWLASKTFILLGCWKSILGVTIFVVVSYHDILL
jgi:hypothetical protein